MAEQFSTLGDAEKRWREVLAKYSRARFKGDFLESVFDLHTALEEALNFHLREQGIDPGSVEAASEEPPIKAKLDAVFPHAADQIDLAALNEQRNWYAHPYRDSSDERVSATAMNLAALLLAVWPHLFTSPQPAVGHPALQTPLDEGLVSRALNQKDIQIQQLQGRIQQLEDQAAARKTSAALPVETVRLAILWRALIFALLLLLPMPLLIGFAWYHWRQQPIIWYWALIPTVLGLVLSFFVLRHLWRFLRGVGLRRLIAGVSMGLVLATLVLIPFTPRGIGAADKAGIALARVLTFVGRAVGGVASGISAFGADLAHAVSPTTSLPAVVPMATMEPTGAPWTAAPTDTATTTQTPQPTAPPATPVATSQRTSTPIPAPTVTGGITVGARVRVKTDGAALMSRAEPGRDKAVVARFDNGSELTVIEGPVAADGITWWKVQGQAGTGWSAADYLVPVANR